MVVVDSAPVSSIPSLLPWHLLSPASYLIVWRELLMPWLKREDEGEEKGFFKEGFLDGLDLSGQILVWKIMRLLDSWSETSAIN